jgi:hypothetical protein
MNRRWVFFLGVTEIYLSGWQPQRFDFGCLQLGQGGGKPCHAEVGKHLFFVPWHFLPSHSLSLSFLIFIFLMNITIISFCSR